MVWKLDPSGRNLADFGRLVARFEQRKIRFGWHTVLFDRSNLQPKP
jgi:hypothetical protein